MALYALLHAAGLPTSAFVHFEYSLTMTYNEYLFSDLLLKVSKHVIDQEKLHFLGNRLGLKDHEISTINYDNHGNINQAGYQVLIEWRKQKISEQMSEIDMKEELRTVLCSDNVEMGEAVSLYL